MGHSAEVNSLCPMVGHREFTAALCPQRKQRRETLTQTEMNLTHLPTNCSSKITITRFLLQILNGKPLQIPTDNIYIHRTCNGTLLRMCVRYENVIGFYVPAPLVPPYRQRQIVRVSTKENTLFLTIVVYGIQFEKSGWTCKYNYNKKVLLRKSARGVPPAV